MKVNVYQGGNKVFNVIISDEDAKQWMRQYSPKGTSRLGCGDSVIKIINANVSCFILVQGEMCVYIS